MALDDKLPGLTPVIDPPEDYGALMARANTALRAGGNPHAQHGFRSVALDHDGKLTIACLCGDTVALHEAA